MEEPTPDGVTLCSYITLCNIQACLFPGGEFLSDTPFFGLSLCTEFQLANCGMREWVELFDELRPEVSPWPFDRFGVAGLEEKNYVHSEVEVHTVCQRLFKKLHGKGLHSMQHLFFMLLLC